ncbi:MAG: ATP synthase F0 subunit B [Deltaproteobacteria bacterium]|nr:ATP synthase F0 subunit B [Deltaproteobacteria bacterium]
MVSLDYTTFFQMINFIALIFILNALLYKPILGIIEKRQNQLQASDAEIKNLRETVDEKMAAYEEKLRLAKTQALEQKNEILKEGAETAKGFIDAAREEIPRIMAEFNEKLGKELDDARHILTRQSQQISIEIAEKVLGRSVQ